MIYCTACERDDIFGPASWLCWPCYAIACNQLGEAVLDTVALKRWADSQPSAYDSPDTEMAIDHGDSFRMSGRLHRVFSRKDGGKASPAPAPSPGPGPKGKPSRSAIGSALSVFSKKGRGR